MCEWNIHDQFANQIVRPGRRVAPGTAFYTCIAHGSFFVGEVETGTAPGIQFPGFVAVVHHLVTR